MKCPRCQTVNTVFTFRSEKTDKCGRCSNFTPQIVKCKHCEASWCPPCWKVTTDPAARPRKPRGGIGDEAFDI